MYSKGLLPLLLVAATVVFGQPPNEIIDRRAPASEFGPAAIQFDTTHDVGVVAIAAPKGTIDSNAILTPACTVANFGSVAESYNVRMKVGSFYDSIVSVESHSPAPGSTSPFRPAGHGRAARSPSRARQCLPATAPRQTTAGLAR